MQDDFQKHLLARINVCEIDNTKLKQRLHIQNVIFSTLILIGVAGSAVASLHTPSSSSATTGILESLRVKELVVVDEKGVIRARVGGNIPLAVIDGKTISRGNGNNGVAGVMLYDKTGVERGGYVTFDSGDNVALTLDNQKTQQVFFGVGPTGRASLQLWEGNEMMDLSADSNGARLTKTKAGVVTQQYPEVNIENQTCQLFKSGIKAELPEALPYAKVKKICEGRFSSAACEPCLPSKP